MAGWHLFWLLLVVLWPGWACAQGAECADVQIVIEQKVSLERQAFDAHMVIRNGLDSSLANVKVELTYLDQNQQPVVATTDPNAVGAIFFERLDQSSGLSALNGTANLPGKTTADIHWLIIPSQGAGGDTAGGRLYYIGAKVTYTLDGQTATVDITPDYVVVRPQPLLVLDYFLPTDVYGDDPFTLQVEPPVPFTLGVRISNIGAGTSVKTTIDSAQPRIVDNQQGLAINFEILGGYVGNAPMGKSLLLDFGDIAPQQSVVGRWIMQTSLSGQFTDFTATFTHADSLGGAVTSLLQSVNTHKLVHDVLIDLPGRDNIPDFLAEAGTGVRVFDSEGGDFEVINVSGQAGLAGLGGGNQRLTFNATPGLIWAKVSDPYGGAKPIVRVLRSDGKVLPAQNYWLSKTRNADMVSWSHAIQLFDSNSTGQYTLEFSAGGSTATLAGQAYFDANGNGIRDAGEAPESNLAITLKGVDQQGGNVLVSATTDTSGNFSFTGVAPGTYQLQAGAVNGQVDGLWMAGSAGGTAQPGAITGIVLTAGTVAQGYLIAKTLPAPPPPPETPTADLSITLQTANASLRAGDTATVTAKVSNAGQGSAQAVIAQVAVPTGLTLQTSSATLGTYAHGVWSLGDLAKDQQVTLTLTVKADPVSGEQNLAISWPASVTSATTDPKLDNNSALLGLTVLADDTNTLELTQSLPSQADMLLLASCPAQAPAEQPGCETEIASQAQTLLAPRVHRLTVVTDLPAWRQAARSGAYNLLWLHGGAGKLNAQQLQEIRAAVQRGATLIVDGPSAAEQAGAPATDLLTDVLGGRLQLPAQGSDQPVHLTGETTSQASAGTLYRIDEPAGNAWVMAQDAGNAPVMLSHPFGLGQAWLSGLDLLQTLAGGSAAFWNDYLGQQIQIFTPAERTDPALAASQLTVQASARSNAAAGSATQDAILSMDVPAGVSYQDATPAPTQTQGQQVQWNLHLAPAASGSGQITLILPQATASLQLQTALLNTAGQTLSSQSLTIQVLDLDTLTPQVQAELAALSDADPAAQSLIGQARDLATAAQDAQTASDWNAALTALANLQATLTQLAQPPHSLSLDALLLDVARWIGLAQSRWQDASGPGGAQAAQVLAHSGSGQSAEIGTAFAAPLVAQVLDEQGVPMQGVVVHFQLPLVTGASATFVTGGQLADTVTNDQGLATSPVLTANGTVGSYQAGASVDGLTQTASFALTNESGSSQPPVTYPAALNPVSGGGQSAEVNTAFAASLVAQVLDEHGDPVEGITVHFQLPATGASAAFAGSGQTFDAVTDVLGMATSPALTANGTVGGYQAHARVDGLTETANFALTNQSGGSQPPVTHPASLQPVSGSGQSALVDTAFIAPLVAQVLDAQGAPVEGVTVHFELPATGASAAFAGGGQTFDAVTGALGLATSPILTANGIGGDYLANASVEGLASVNFVLTNESNGGQPPAAPAILSSVSGSGQSAQVNTAFGNPLVAQVLDAQGAPVSGIVVHFQLPATGASAAFAGGSQSADAVTNAQGLATSPAVTANGIVGDYLASASVDGLIETASFALANQSSGGQPPPTPATLSTISGSGQSAQVNTAFGNPLVAQVLDAHGDPVAGVVVHFQLPVTGASAAFATGGQIADAVTNDQGLATSPVLTANAMAGDYMASASVAGLTSVSFTLTNQDAGGQPPVTPATLSPVSGSGQSAQVNTAFAAALVVKVLDAQGAPVSGLVVHFQLPAMGASAVFTSGGQIADAVTNDQGLATSPALTANGTVGSYQASASVEGLTPVSFALANQSAGPPPVGPPASLHLLSGAGQSAQVGTAFAAPIEVQVLDASGQPVPSASVKIEFAASGASATFPGGQNSVTLTTDSLGTAASPAFTANSVPGAHQAKVTVTGLAAMMVDLTNVAQPPTLSLQLIQGANQSAPIGQAYGLGFMVRVVDNQGQPKAGAAVLFTLPASGPSGSFGQGRTSVSITTGADGVALSPVPVANNAQGNYQAQAATAGAAQLLQLPMNNLPYAGSGKQFSGAVATGTGAMTAQVSGGGDTCVFNPLITKLIPADGSLAPGNSFKLPYGLLDFELVGCDPGSTVTVSTTWPDLKGVSGYLKHGRPDSNSNAIWYVPGSMTLSGNTITYAIQDGGKGDDDLTVNGVIRDPGGPFTGSFATAIPTLSTWTLALLAALLAMLGVRPRRR
jgi:uncharacterized repeat protein (TIGR01451 family)